MVKWANCSSARAVSYTKDINDSPVVVDSVADEVGADDHGSNGPTVKYFAAGAAMAMREDVEPIDGIQDGPDHLRGGMGRVRTDIFKNAFQISQGSGCDSDVVCVWHEVFTG
jgi:hypothetical protein